MVEIAHSGVIRDKGVLGLDPFKSAGFAKLGFSEAIATLAKVAKGKGGLKNSHSNGPPPGATSWKA